MSGSYPQATLFGTEVRQVTSSIVGQDYQISVWLLPDYASSQKTYPVVYLLDANFSTGMAIDIARWLVYSREVPELIIVGVGHDIRSYAEFAEHRDRDYTPTAQSDYPSSGGASKFLAFLEGELIPFIDSIYRTNSTDRAIWGYSSSGLFVLYSLLQKPTLFQRYIAGSPAVEWDERLLFRYANELAEKQSLLPVKVYISVGSLETNYVGQVKEFTETLTGQNFSGLNLKTEIFDGETHFSGFALSFIHGLKSVFEK